MARIELIAPQDLSEVTLGQWMELQRMDNPTPQQVVGLLCDGDLRSIPKRELDYIYNSLMEMLSQDLADFKPTIELEGKMFGLADFANLTTGEYIDTEAFALNEQIDNLFCVLYRPIVHIAGDSYEVEEYHERHLENAETIRELPMTLVNGVLVFFSTIENEYLKSSQASSLKVMKEKVKEARQMVGDGIGL